MCPALLYLAWRCRHMHVLAAPASHGVQPCGPLPEVQGTGVAHIMGSSKQHITSTMQYGKLGSPVRQDCSTRKSTGACDRRR